MIYIITVFKSNNYGSLLQARALYDYLNKYETTIFINNGQRRSFGLLQIRQIIASLLKDRNVNKALFFLRKFLNNSNGWKKLPSVKTIGEEKNNLIILGSDEIWNVARHSCSDPIFWGDSMCGYIISYAPSANNTKIEDLNKPVYKDYLSRISRISVRDTHTRILIESLTNKPIAEVLDPTMLFDINYYKEHATCPEIGNDYIAVYLFEKKLTQREIAAIKIFARKKCLRLVSIGPWIDWCDENLLSKDNNPFLYYINAKYVITNTFHGTAFAINFSTQFIAYTNDNLKVFELLRTFGLSNRIANGMGEEELNNLFNQDIDTNRIMSLMAFMRSQSVHFLNQAIINKNEYIYR